MSAILKKAPHRLPLLFWAAMALLLAATCACVGLWYLKYVHDRSVRTMATQSVLEQGGQMADYLAEISPLCPTPLSPEQWQMFYELVDGLHAAQKNLQFISVSRDGVTLINRQTGAVPGGESQPRRRETNSVASIRGSVTQRVLELGGNEVPVMIFHREISLPDKGGRIDVEVGLRDTAVDQEEQAATGALSSLFRLSVLTLAGSFGACLLLIVWIVRRDREWTDRRRQEEHLAFSGMLANGIVHDFRNPMSSVRLDAQMLERELKRPEGARPERLAELAGRMNRTVERMDKVFQEFLYLARPAEEAHEPVDLAECVRECLETLAPRFEQAGVTPATTWEHTPLRVLASPFALRRALLNVLMNALQFSPAGNRVEVVARIENESVVLDIQDRGPGIPAADRRRIFEMFVTSRPGGTGLGLFLARTAVRKCGGEIEALPRDGGGSVIRITLRAAGSLDSGNPPPES
jgi:signal transduction histidine kinase